MSPERWSEVARIFGLAVERDPSERAGFVAAECGFDSELEREVLELIAADQRSGDVLGGLTGAVREMLASGSEADTAPDSKQPIAVGDVVDQRYRVERIIGSGGMGIVVEATHIELRERVAMKLLHPQILSSARLRERFLREARAVASVKSPHIVRMRDVGIDDHDAPYMVMDLLAGVDLATLLAQRGPLPVAQAVLVVLQACDALAVAHDAGIVHRDIKPANLFLEQVNGSTTLKLLDFGVSKHSDDDATLTQSGDLVGSPAYMSPEQLRSSRDVDARTDIWSLGVVLYELVAGRRPFAASSKADLYAVVLQQAPAPLPDVPPRLASAIARCLEKDPTRRFDSVNELAAQLAPLAGAAGFAQAARVAKTTGVVAPIDVDAPRSRMRWIGAAAIALLVAGSVALFLLERRGEAVPAAEIDAVDAASVASFEPPEPALPVATVSAAPPEPSRAPAPPPRPPPAAQKSIPPQPASTGLDPYGSRL